MKQAGALIVLLSVSGCDPERSVGYDETARLSGTFDVNVTNGANGCALADWAAGAVTMNIPVSIEQQGTGITANVGGLAGLAVSLGYGSSAYVGMVEGRTLVASVRATTAAARGACMVTWSSTIFGAITGDFLQGRVEHRPEPVDPACLVDRCTNVQTFNGQRPPTP